MITDAIGRAVAFVLAPGQDHELPYAVLLLDKLPGVPRWVVADRAYSSNAFREHIWNLGARPVIPTRRNEGTLSCPSWIYTNRNPGRAAVGTAERMARSRYALRKNRQFLHGHPLPRRHMRLDQALTGPNPI